MKKVPFLAILSLALALPLTTSVSNATSTDQSTVGSNASNPIIIPNNPGTLIPSPSHPGNGDGSITPQKSQDAFTTNLGNNKNATVNFVVAQGYGHLKLKVVNTGSSTITFSLQHISTGKVFITKTVGSGNSLDWYSDLSFPNGIYSGDYVIQFRAGGDLMNGKAYGITGQQISDIR